MLALHFGAGNIGRGFIGQVLYESNYNICFVDVNQEVIDEINKLGKYRIKIVGDIPKYIEIKNVIAINSNDIDEVIKKIVQADIITTALGANVLKFIAPVIAKGIVTRLKVNNKPLNIVACENMIGASSILKELVYKYLPKEKLSIVKEKIGFPNAAVDRIVPIQENKEKLLVETEEFFEWDIEEKSIIGQKPNIKGINYVDNLQAYIERKLYAINATHASIAYLGYVYNKKTIYEAIQDENIMKIVNNIIRESGTLLIKKYNFDKVEYQNYMNVIIQRFSNKYISDNISRVARSPIRKIGKNERLVAPANELIKYGIFPNSFATIIAAALHFKNENDVEAMELQNFINKYSVEKALEKYSEIKPNSVLSHFILEKYHELI